MCPSPRFPPDGSGKAFAATADPTIIYRGERTPRGLATAQAQEADLRNKISGRLARLIREADEVAPLVDAIASTPNAGLALRLAGQLDDIAFALRTGVQP